MDTSNPKPFRIGQWHIEPLQHCLSRGREQRRITPKAMNVLWRLSLRAGEVVRREELLAAVWPDSHVGEEVLTRAISDLRSSFGDDRRQPRFIETIPKVGYRLIAEVSLNGAESARPSVDAGTVSPTGSSLAGGRRGAGWITAIVLAVAAGAGVMAVVWPRQPSPTPNPTRLSSTASLSARPLTTMAGFESRPELSPDGREVAFTWSGPEGENTDIWVVPVSGGEPRRITTDPAVDVGATWSPDGLRLAFGRYRDEGCQVYEIAVTGGPERLLGSCGRNGAADHVWSPDGEWIAFSDRESDDVSFGIYLLSTLTGQRRKLVAPDGQHWGDRDPSFSPDGRQVAFTRSVSMATNDVYRVSIEGGEALPVSHDGRPIRGHVWSRDGSAVIVSSRRTAARGLWSYPLNGDPPTWLPVPADHAWRPTLSRAEGPLVFENRILQTGIGRLSRQPGAAIEPWLEATREDLDPQHSPDGRRVAFSSNRSGFFEIWTALANGEEPRQLTALGASFTGGPRWSPDGNSIVFDSRLDGQADLYAVDSDGGAPRRLTDHPGNDLAPSFSADGRVIYFGSNRTGRWQIWRRSTTGSGELRQMTRAGGYLALESADGSSLFFTKYGRPGLFNLSLADGSESPVPGTETLVGPEHWTVADDGVYLVTATGDALHLARLAGDAVEVLGGLGDDPLMAGLSIAPDSGTVLFSRLTRLESDLWRADFLGRTDDDATFPDRTGRSVNETE